MDRISNINILLKDSQLNDQTCENVGKKILKDFNIMDSIKINTNKDNDHNINKRSLEIYNSLTKKEIDLFNFQMNLTSQYLNSYKGVTVGYGAAHMLATLNYHLSNSIEGLDFILDDNSSMDGFQYKNIKVTVRSTENFDWNSVDAVFITSMENRRFMTAKIIQNYDVRVICSNIL